MVKLWIVTLLLLGEGSNHVHAFSSSLSMMASSVQTTNTGKGKTTVIAGATGYIGKSVVRESVRQGYNTIALVRDVAKVSSPEGKMLYGDFFEGATVVECDVCDANKLTEVCHCTTVTDMALMQQLLLWGDAYIRKSCVTKSRARVSHEPLTLSLQTLSPRCSHNSPIAQTCKSLTTESTKIDAIISCLASRSGTKKDAYKIDYQATLNCLEAGRAVGARHFVMLSAFCVKNPWLQFQQAKLKFEAALQAQHDLTYTIVRPTAFFKSVSGQLEVVQSGAPFVMFGDGEVTRCNPIAEADLATYLVDCIADKARVNGIINLGGPDEPLTMKKQGEMLFKAVGKEPNFFFAPLWLFDVIIDSLQWVADTFESEAFEDFAETGRIGKYYAVEDMLTTASEEKFGTMTLQEHYDKIAVEGQEYDPYTTMFAPKPKD